MSWKCTLHLWSLGPLDVHVFLHGCDTRTRFVTVGWNLREWWVWPLRAWAKFDALAPSRPLPPRPYRAQPTYLVKVGEPQPGFYSDAEKAEQLAAQSWRRDVH